MNVEQSVLHRFFNNALHKSMLRKTAKSDETTSSQDFWWKPKPEANAEKLTLAANTRDDHADITIANREVYLEGYETHEQVVRAYLEFAGIDPDSKEGQLYFRL
jgi:hypothetical protein